MFTETEPAAALRHKEAMEAIQKLIDAERRNQVLQAIDKIELRLNDMSAEVGWLQEAHERLKALLDKIAQGLGIDPGA